MKHIWSPKLKSRVINSVNIFKTLNLGYNAKSKVKLLLLAVTGSKRSLRYISSSKNSNLDAKTG